MIVGPTVLPGCGPVSHRGGSDVGVAVLHGFTGNPSSVRGVADAMIEAGHHVEAPLLPGHGTVVDDMVETRWADWMHATDQAINSLRDRSSRVVLFGQSMGGSLALAAALQRGDSGEQVAGVIVVNPATRVFDDATREMIDEFLDDGMVVAPGEGSDIADPDSSDISYDGTPLAAVRSLMLDGVASFTDRLSDGAVPLLVMTSRQDHVVDPGDSVFLVERWAGPVDHVWLERSYHVATRDFDRDLVNERSLDFVAQVAA